MGVWVDVNVAIAVIVAPGVKVPVDVNPEYPVPAGSFHNHAAANTRPRTRMDTHSPVTHCRNLVKEASGMDKVIRS